MKFCSDGDHGTVCILPARNGLNQVSYVIFALGIVCLKYLELDVHRKDI